MTEPTEEELAAGVKPTVILDENGLRIKTGERRCKNQAIPGGRVCLHHGGALPATRQKAAERLGYISAREAVQTKLGMIVTDRDPRQILLEQVYASYGMVLAARALLDDVTPIDLFAQGGEDPVAWEAKGKLALYSEWVERAAKISKMALDAGIDERMVHLAEQQSSAVVNVLQIVLNNPTLQLSADKQAMFRQLVAQEFRSLSAGAPQFEFTPAVVQAPMKRGNGNKPFRKLDENPYTAAQAGRYAAKAAEDAAAEAARNAPIPESET
jgi:hypothetical protein